MGFLTSLYARNYPSISESLAFALLKGHLLGLTGPGRLHLRFLPQFFPSYFSVKPGPPHIQD